jgi:CDGSH-type Zn-finger protein
MANDPDAPCIACLPNGPYYLIFESEPYTVPYVRAADGASVKAKRAVALCRCGGSKTKPLCDGSHGTNGFNDRRISEGGNDRRENYVGTRITIHDNRALCAHAGHCTEGLPAVFRESTQPWIDADAATVEEIVAIIGKCPSGALSYSIDGVEHRDREGTPRVEATRNGPYAVSGGVELLGMSFGEGASTEHYTLCRCGASRNKPFCDGSHWDVNFQDPSD